MESWQHYVWNTPGMWLLLTTTTSDPLHSKPSLTHTNTHFKWPSCFRFCPFYSVFPQNSQSKPLKVKMWWCHCSAQNLPVFSITLETNPTSLPWPTKPHRVWYRLHLRTHLLPPFLVDFSSFAMLVSVAATCSYNCPFAAPFPGTLFSYTSTNLPYHFPGLC